MKSGHGWSLSDLKIGKDALQSPGLIRISISCSGLSASRRSRGLLTWYGD